MEIEKILRFFSDYGIAIVITAIFLTIIIRAVNLAFKYFEKKLGFKQHDKQLEVRNEVNKKIQQLINDFLERTKGDRTQVIEFSNTVSSVAYLPFRYMTCTYETYRYDLSPAARFIDKLPTSLFTPFFEKLQGMRSCEFVVNEKTLATNEIIYDLLAKYGGEKFLITLMKSIRGKPVGILIFEKQEGFDEADREGLLCLSKQLTSLLCILDC